MKPSRIIFGSDDNNGYLNFWRDVSEICKKRLGIEPVLFHITEENSDFYQDEFGTVKKIKRIPDIPSSFQAQNIRFFGTKFFEDDVCVISDIDLFLIDKNYFSKIENIPEDEFVIMESDAYDPKRYETGGWSGEGRYFAPYTVGSGKIFNKIFEFPDTFEEYVTNIFNLNLGFATDEMVLAKKVDNQTSVKVNKLKRGWMSNFYCPKRIEKINFIKSDGTELEVNDSIDVSFFIDCHCASPYEQYQEKIKTVKNKILSL
jgi:hypothetical protein